MLVGHYYTDVAITAGVTITIKTQQITHFDFKNMMPAGLRWQLLVIEEHSMLAASPAQGEVWML